MDENQDKNTIKDVLKQARLVTEVTQKSRLSNNSYDKTDSMQISEQKDSKTGDASTVSANKVEKKQSPSSLPKKLDLQGNINSLNPSLENSSFLNNQIKAERQTPQSKKSIEQVLNSSKTVFHSNKLQVTSQAKTFLAGGFTLFFAFLLIVGAIRPTISDIVRIKSQLRTYKRIATQLDDKIDDIYQLRDVLSQKKATLAYFDIYYPHNLDYSLFISNLEYMTRQEKAKLLSVNYSEHVRNEYVKRFKKKGIKEIVPVVFSITIQGDYNQLITFLKQIEDTPYLPQVITMGYRADQRDQTRTFTLNVLLFRLKKPILKLKSNEDILQYVSSTQ